MQDSYLNFQKRQMQKISPATFKHGVITAVYRQSWSADVVVEGDVQTVLKGIPMSSAVPYNVRVGQLCRIDMFDETNPKDSVVAYTYGTAPSSVWIVKTGTAYVTSNGQAIPHGLGQKPDFYILMGYGQVISLAGVTYGGIYTADYGSGGHPADATNIYSLLSGNVVVSAQCVWAALVIPNKNF
jgi:hypothetical protein